MAHLQVCLSKSQSSDKKSSSCTPLPIVDSTSLQNSQSYDSSRPQTLEQISSLIKLEPRGQALTSTSSQASKKSRYLEYSSVALPECLSCTYSSEWASCKSPLLTTLTCTNGVFPSRVLKVRGPLLSKLSISYRVRTQVRGLSNSKAHQRSKQNLWLNLRPREHSSYSSVTWAYCKAFPEIVPIMIITGWADCCRALLCLDPHAVAKHFIHFLSLELYSHPETWWYSHFKAEATWHSPGVCPFYPHQSSSALASNVGISSNSPLVKQKNTFGPFYHWEATAVLMSMFIHLGYGKTECASG